VSARCIHAACVHGRTHRCAPTGPAWLYPPITQASREALRRPAVFLARPDTGALPREAVRLRPLAVREAVRLRALPAREAVRLRALPAGVQGHCPCRPAFTLQNQSHILCRAKTARRLSASRAGSPCSHRQSSYVRCQSTRQTPCAAFR